MDTLQKLKDALFQVRTDRITTGNGLEKVVRDNCKKHHLLCIRTDYKNNVPDFLISDGSGQFIFLECKYYGAAKHLDWRVAMSRYQQKQKKQYEAFCKLALKAPIYFLFVSKQKHDNNPSLNIVKLGEHYE